MAIFRSKFGPVELTLERELHIYKFHPEVKRYKKNFDKCITAPNIIRRSKFDASVLILYLFLPQRKYLAIVIKSNKRNFILTAYLTKKIQQQRL